MNAACSRTHCTRYQVTTALAPTPLDKTFKITVFVISFSVDMVSVTGEVVQRHPTLHHVPVSVISDGVDMRWDLVSFLPFVHVDDLF